MKNRFTVFALASCFVLGALPLAAQNNIIENGDFEDASGYIEYTDYAQVIGPYGVGAGFYCIDNTTANHAEGGLLPWPTVVGYGGSGRFMIVNGFGGSVNATKVVWRQTVDVTTQTEYTFTCHLFNLSRNNIFFPDCPSSIRLKINNVTVGEDFTLDMNTQNWQTMTRTWYSGNNTQVVIEIYDVFSGNTNNGDDFCMDAISFVPAVVYDATAYDDEGGAVCLNNSIFINVLDNDDILPNANDANVSVVEGPQYGTALALSDGRIRYEYNVTGDAASTDQFKYRVTNHGVSSEAWVTLTLNRMPSIGEIVAPNGICAGGSFTLTQPSLQNNGSEIIEQGWEIAPSVTDEALPFDNEDVPYDFNGSFLRYKAVNGCGTSYSNWVQLTVFSTAPTYESITACDTYTWNGQVCDHSDEYSAQVTTENGCEITAYLHFELSDAYTQSDTVIACNEYYWPKNDSTFYETTEYEYVVDIDDPLVCDSVFTLHLTVNHMPEILESLVSPSETCVGQPLQVTVPQYAPNQADGYTAQWEYAVPEEGVFMPFDPENQNLVYGDYMLRFVVSNSCESVPSNVVPFRVNDVPLVQGALSDIEVCADQPLNLPVVSVNWRNANEDDRFAQWQMSPSETGIFAGFDTLMPLSAANDGFWLRFVASNSCGEGILGPVRVSVLSIDDQWLETEEHCDVYDMGNGQSITESQVLSYESEIPCHHIVYQPIVIIHSDSTTVSITSCHDEYVWHGMTFYRSEETQTAYWDTLNVVGCDSVVKLQLDFGNYSSYTFSRTDCDFFYWEVTDSVYLQSTHDSLFVAAPVGSDGCDTWYYLELTLGHDTLVQGEPMTECAGFEWHGIYYYEDAVLYDTLETSGTRCDSVVWRYLNVIQPFDTAVSMSKCQPFWWNGHYCDHNDDYTHIFHSGQGCDSIVTLHFSLMEALQLDVDTTACTPFLWNGHWCDEDGAVYEKVFLTAEGCDSTVYLHLSLIPSDIGEIHGDSMVYVATSTILGVYRYEIDAVGVTGEIEWSLSNPNWMLLSGDGPYSCRVLASTPGHATLKAEYNSVCGPIERTFEIYAVFFDVTENHSIAVDVFPNPARTTVTVSAEGIESVRVIDLLGQTLIKVSGGEAGSVMLNTEAFAPSVYLIEVKTKNGIAMKRLVLSK